MVIASARTYSDGQKYSLYVTKKDYPIKGSLFDVVVILYVIFFSIIHNTATHAALSYVVEEMIFFKYDYYTDDARLTLVFAPVKHLRF
jgi:hypothetical protein